MCVSHSVVTESLFVTPWTVAHQPLLSMEFSRQEYCFGLLFTSPWDPLNPGIKPIAPATSPALQADSLPSEPPGKPILQPNCEFISHHPNLRLCWIWSSSSHESKFLPRVQECFHWAISYNSHVITLSSSCWLNRNQKRWFSTSLMIIRSQDCCYLYTRCKEAYA